MLTAVGFVMVVLSGAAIGFYAAGMRKKRIAYVASLVHLIRHISFKITYFRCEVAMLFDDFIDDDLDAIGFSEELGREGLLRALRVCNERFSLRAYESNALESLASSLGKSSWEDQVNMCDSVITVLEKYIEELNEKYPEERKLFSSLGIIAGLLVAVVLV